MAAIPATLPPLQYRFWKNFGIDCQEWGLSGIVRAKDLACAVGFGPEMPECGYSDTTDRSHFHTLACVDFPEVVGPNDFIGRAESLFGVG